MSNSYAIVSALIFAVVARAIQRVDECVVGCPCRFCPARNLGLHTIKLIAATHLLRSKAQWDKTKPKGRCQCQACGQCEGQSTRIAAVFFMAVPLFSL